MTDDVCTAQVSDMCCEAMKTLFREDRLGYASLGAVKVLSGMIKGRHFNVRPEVSRESTHT